MTLVAGEVAADAAGVLLSCAVAVVLTKQATVQNARARALGFIVFYLVIDWPYSNGRQQSRSTLYLPSAEGRFAEKFVFFLLSQPEAVL